MKKKEKKVAQTPIFERRVDQYFYEMDQRLVAGDKIVYAVFLTLLFFGVMGIVWMIPFPQFDFLKSVNMHTFLNWGSFYIALIIYLYLRLAPTLSYAILFSIGVMSFLIVQLEYLERTGGPAVLLISFMLAIIGFAGLFIYSKKESPAPSSLELWRLITLGPIWLWSKIFQKLKIKY